MKKRRKRRKRREKGIMRKKRKWEWVTLLTRLNGSAARVEAQWAHNSAQVEMSIKTYPLH